ncbi:MAG: hydroxyacylglutathione hydrolase [Candidatus Omnitrophica bacterium]|nr:hydroxyacylglutathione hydrolase [Candidatus Omnitrophota bacterium]
MRKIITIPAGYDNYIYLIVNNGAAVVVDPTSASSVITSLKEHGVTLEYILITHGHGDHTGGLAELKERTGAKAIGPDGSISGIDEIAPGRTEIASRVGVIRVIATPGHTRLGASYYVLPNEDDRHGAVFTGDTLFIGGCGRIFGAAAETMWHSLRKIAELPKETRVYPGHEYTIENYEFACTVERGNETFRERLVQVNAVYKKHGTTVPSTIADEIASNVFIRAATPSVFAELRRRKDDF